MFEDLASKGYTRFTINIDQSCEKCYNMRLLKVRSWESCEGLLFSDTCNKMRTFLSWGNFAFAHLFSLYHTNKKLFSTRPCTTLNSIPIILNLLTNRNIALIYSITICEQKTKVCAWAGSFQHKLQHHLFHVWCLPSNQSHLVLTMVWCRP